MTSMHKVYCHFSSTAVDALFTCMCFRCEIVLCHTMHFSRVTMQTFSFGEGRGQARAKTYIRG